MMFSWTLRIAGWIIGIYALLKLATVTGTVTYTTVFQAWMDQLRDFLDLGFILKPLTQAVILPALDLIRSFGITIPALQDHWQQVFVLTWLLTAAWVRNAELGVPTSVALGIAFIFTLPFCVAAGTLPLGSGAIPVWALAGFLAVQGVVDLLWLRWLAALIGLVVVAFTSALGYWVPDYALFVFAGLFFTLALVFIAQVFKPFTAFFPELQSLPMVWIGLKCAAFGAACAGLGYLNQTTGAGALVALAGIIFGYGLWALVDGLETAEGTLRQRLQDPAAATGLDITAAMLGAFGLATAFADPPLF